VPQDVADVRDPQDLSDADRSANRRGAAVESGQRRVPAPAEQSRLEQALDARPRERDQRARREDGSNQTPDAHGKFDDRRCPMLPARGRVNPP